MALHKNVTLYVYKRNFRQIMEDTELYTKQRQNKNIQFRFTPRDKNTLTPELLKF